MMEKCLINESHFIKQHTYEAAANYPRDRSAGFLVLNPFLMARYYIIVSLRDTPVSMALDPEHKSCQAGQRVGRVKETGEEEGGSV